MVFAMGFLDGIWMILRIEIGNFEDLNWVDCGEFGVWIEKWKKMRILVKCDDFIEWIFLHAFFAWNLNDFGNRNWKKWRTG